MDKRRCTERGVMITCARKSTGQTGTVSSKESHTSSFPTSFEEECPAPSLTYVFSQRASCVVIPWLLRSLQWKKKLNAATDLKGIEQPVPRRFDQAGNTHHVGVPRHDLSKKFDDERRSRKKPIQSLGRSKKRWRGSAAKTCRSSVLCSPGRREG